VTLFYFESVGTVLGGVFSYTKQLEKIIIQPELAVYAGKYDGDKIVMILPSVGFALSK